MLKELRVRSAPLVPAAMMVTVRAEVAAQPGDQWPQLVCGPWRLALGVLNHTRYKPKAPVHTLPLYLQIPPLGLEPRSLA